MESALIVLSGGQDSTTCLYWALKHFNKVRALTFDYDQRHRIELQSACKIAEIARVPHEILPINTFKEMGGNALTSDQHEVSSQLQENKLPNTFVPGRNLIFLTFAAAYAYQHQIRQIVTGVCETDYSGYPDCRYNTIRALELSLNLGMESKLQIHTPLMWLTKAETVKMAKELSAMEAMAWTHTCYNGEFPPCRTCPACEIRQRGFEEAGIIDPLLQRTGHEQS